MNWRFSSDNLFAKLIFSSDCELFLVIVVKDGEIVSKGSHEELVESSHEY